MGQEQSPDGDRQGRSSFVVAGATGQDEAAIGWTRDGEEHHLLTLVLRPAGQGRAAGRAWPAGLVLEVPLCSPVAAAAAAAALRGRVLIILQDVQDALDHRARAGSRAAPQGARSCAVEFNS